MLSQLHKTSNLLTHSIIFSLQNTKVYAISGLNTALSTALNMPMVGAVGLMDVSATKELCDLAAHSFTTVSISNKVRFLIRLY